MIFTHGGSSKSTIAFIYTTTMWKVLEVKGVCVLAAVLAVTAQASALAKPNIVHIVGDDIGSNDFNFSRGTNP
jgi:hypothetical protein